MSLLPMPPAMPTLPVLVAVISALGVVSHGLKVHSHVYCNISYYAVTSDSAGKLTAVEPGGQLEYLPHHGAPLAVLLHGLGGAHNDSFSRHVVTGLERLGRRNVLVVDYAPLVPATDYQAAVKSVPVTGRLVAQFLSAIPVPLEIIGYSLGAHVAGVAGHLLATHYNITVQRIIGLDPAGPGFEALERDKKLDARDAAFVMVMHTAGGGIGALEPCGDVDFYPNGGQAPQPHCLMPYDHSQRSWGVEVLVETMCSHSAAYIYLADSTRGGYTATRCSSWESFMAGHCMAEPTLQMGFTVPANARGKYYLRTRSEPPLGEIEDYPDGWFADEVGSEVGSEVPLARSDSKREMDAWDLLTGLLIIGGQAACIYVIYHYGPHPHH